MGSETEVDAPPRGRRDRPRVVDPDQPPAWLDLVLHRTGGALGRGPAAAPRTASEAVAADVEIGRVRDEEGDATTRTGYAPATG